MTISLDRLTLAPADHRWSRAQLNLIAAGRRLYREESVIVQQTSGRNWVVVDARAPEDGRSLLGLIDRRNDEYEVTQIKGGFSRHAFGTLHEAIDQLADTIPFSEILAR
jgi:hypothetical protein